MPTDRSEQPGDLGFRYRVRKAGHVEIVHHGRLAATLRGNEASEFLAEAPEPRDPTAQELMARITGNYKRGNERLAAGHLRNKR